MSEIRGAGRSDEWYTPPEYFEALGVTFDLDVASPSIDHWVPAKKVFTKEDDGLNSEWSGFVWMNPPFGGRNGQVPWISKFTEHGNGIGLVSARTSAGWFHDYLAPNVDAILFPKGKTKFIDHNGKVGKSPADGVVLFACGEIGVETLRNCGLGFFIDLTSPHDKE